MAKTNTSTNIIVQNLTIKTNARKTQEIENWKAGIKQFTDPAKPLRTLLYDLVEDIQTDGQIKSAWEKRQDAILNKTMLFVKDGKEDEELLKLLNSPDLRRLIKELHNSIAWGFTLVQVNNIYFDEEREQYKIDFDLIPRKHVHPERAFECVSIEQNQITKDILYKEPPLNRYMIWAGDPIDMGLFVVAAQYVIYKRGDFGDWAQFAEMFGMPFREGRYDDYDDNTRVALEKMMEAYGNAAYAILPKNADFKLHDAVKGTAGDLYKTLYDACNAEISKILLGNTLTTDQGDSGSRALGTVHQDGENSKFKSDEKLILDILNGDFKAILKTFGFNVQGGEIWYKSPDKDWTELKTKWEVVNGIRQAIPVDDDFIYEEFDIPKPADYEAQKTKMDTADLNAIQQIKQGNEPNRNIIGNRIKWISDFFG